MEQDTILGGIPMQLVQRCAMYVNTLHTRQPSNYEDILWHKETMVTIMAFEDTRNVLSSWKSAWRRKTKDESLIVICGMILAAEILKANYKGWGARYPGGFNAASKMLLAYPPFTHTYHILCRHGSVGPFAKRAGNS